MPQVVGVDAKPSSTTPSQLLSIPSHTSDMGVPAMHVFADPETHEGTVFWQAPTPQVTVPRPSSTEPLQLLSIPSHTSAVGVPATHEFATAPFTHELTPAEAHAPTPQAVGPGTKSSSTWPLQSSSIPLHVASLGAGVPGVHVSVTTWLTHAVTPIAAQAPTPQVVAVVVGTKSSSAWPLQS